jgi:hypothetical protein
MRQFVSQQLPPRERRRGTLAWAKHNMMLHGIGLSIHCSRRFFGEPVSVNTDVAEVVPEPGFKERSSSGVERLPGGIQHIMDNPRSRRWSRCRGPAQFSAFELVVLFFVLFLTRAASPLESTVAILRTYILRIRHAHHLFGDAVCFLLVDVSGRTYR